MIKSVKNKAIPISSTLGGVCCVPKALLKNDKTIITLVNDVVSIRKDGARDRTVRKISNLTVSTVAPVVASFPNCRPVIPPIA
jgi:hypothetical protein